MQEAIYQGDAIEIVTLWSQPPRQSSHAAFLLAADSLHSKENQEPEQSKLHLGRTWSKQMNTGDTVRVVTC